MNVKGGYGRFGCIGGELGKLLLVQRGWGVDPNTKAPKWDGRWNLPGGGVNEQDVENSFTPEQIVIREVKEETGLDVVFADFRPIGEYPTVKHTDVAMTYMCVAVGGSLKTNKEGVSFLYATPDEIMDMARKGDVSEGLVGGIQTSTGGIPRHVQMCLHYFTRIHPPETVFYESAKKFCKQLGIPV